MSILDIFTGRTKKADALAMAHAQNGINPAVIGSSFYKSICKMMGKARIKVTPARFYGISIAEEAKQIELLSGEYRYSVNIPGAPMPLHMKAVADYPSCIMAVGEFISKMPVEVHGINVTESQTAGAINIRLYSNLREVATVTMYPDA
ncbi:hypothetical protein Q6670_004104 [Salmonella enterica]|nr:hypothetical protein [Salmonella enterica]